MTIATASTGWVLPIDQLTWSRADWLDAYHDDACQLAMADLHRLLQMHGSTVAELQAELTAGQLQGAGVLPLTHAAQALTWLGY